MGHSEAIDLTLCDDELRHAVLRGVPKEPLAEHLCTLVALPSELLFGVTSLLPDPLTFVVTLVAYVLLTLRTIPKVIPVLLSDRLLDLPTDGTLSEFLMGNHWDLIGLTKSIVIHLRTSFWFIFGAFVVAPLTGETMAPALLVYRIGIR